MNELTLIGTALILISGALVAAGIKEKMAKQKVPIRNKNQVKK